MTKLPASEIPEQLRNLVQTNVDQAKAAYDKFTDATEKLAKTLEASEIPVSPGLADVNKKIMDFTKANIDSNFDVASKLAKAKDVAEAIEIQAAFAQNQMKAFSQQTEELGALMQKAVPAAR
jgi:phasin